MAKRQINNVLSGILLVNGQRQRTSTLVYSAGIKKQRSSLQTDHFDFTVFISPEGIENVVDEVVQLVVAAGIINVAPGREHDNNVVPSSSIHPASLSEPGEGNRMWWQNLKEMLSEVYKYAIVLHADVSVAPDYLRPGKLTPERGSLLVAFFNTTDPNTHPDVTVLSIPAREIWAYSIGNTLRVRPATLTISKVNISGKDIEFANRTIHRNGRTSLLINYFGKNLRQPRLPVSCPGIFIRSWSYQDGRSQWQRNVEAFDQLRDGIYKTELAAGTDTYKDPEIDRWIDAALAMDDNEEAARYLKRQYMQRICEKKRL
ncbi:hypothetical protein C8Q75DRAFT_745611 [Abortiporus biennis]|nr:hypothetical protein C8Q75DRAFT_745611 [Abortiporus biennis]